MFLGTVRNTLTIQKKIYIVYLLNVLSFYLKYGIFMHFKCFLTKKKTHFECINKPKIILSLQYFDFGHTKLPYPLSNKKRYLWLQQARPNRIISSLQLPDILIFTRKRLFCNTIKLTFLCNIHCTVIFTAIK